VKSRSFCDGGGGWSVLLAPPPTLIFNWPLETELFCLLFLCRAFLILRDEAQAQKQQIDFLQKQIQNDENTIQHFTVCVLLLLDRTSSFSSSSSLHAFLVRCSPPPAIVSAPCCYSTTANDGLGSVWHRTTNPILTWYGIGSRSAMTRKKHGRGGRMDQIVLLHPLKIS
jgi:hypothetical protein